MCGVRRGQSLGAGGSTKVSSVHPGSPGSSSGGARAGASFDLNEVAPGPDEDDDWDANVGARMLYKLIGWALRDAAA